MTDGAQIYLFKELPSAVLVRCFMGNIPESPDKILQLGQPSQLVAHVLKGWFLQEQNISYQHCLDRSVLFASLASQTAGRWHSRLPTRLSESKTGYRTPWNSRTHRDFRRVHKPVSSRSNDVGQQQAEGKLSRYKSSASSGRWKSKTAG